MAKQKQAKSRRNFKRMLRPLALVLAAGVVLSIIYFFNQEPLKNRVALQKASYDFVDKFGSYDSGSYEETINNLRPRLTHEYYTQLADKDTVAAKQDAMRRNNLAFQTMSAGKPKDIKIGLENERAIARVLASEVVYKQGSEPAENSIEYVLFYKKVDNKWLIEKVYVDRVNES